MIAQGEAQPWVTKTEPTFALPGRAHFSAPQQAESDERIVAALPAPGSAGG